MTDLTSRERGRPTRAKTANVKTVKSGHEPKKGLNTKKGLDTNTD
jgi:hypothetical protein